VHNALVEIVCEFADDPFWRDERLRLFGSNEDLLEETNAFGIDDDVAHVLVLVLSRLPLDARRGFAETFLSERRRRRTRGDPVAAAAGIVLEALPLLERRPDIRTDRVVDLLQGAAQGDDLTLTPPSAVGEAQKVVARIRLDVAFDDQSSVEGNVAHAIAEVLDPSGGTVDVKEIFARCAWAAVSGWERPRVLAFLLRADALLHETVSDTS
jgi:hypothetical protein